MDQFRGLASNALVSAREQMSRLLFDWEPPVPDLEKLRDRLSNASSGYSSAADPANGLRDGYYSFFRGLAPALLMDLSRTEAVLRAAGTGALLWRG
jgi:hypothetical protein